MCIRDREIAVAGAEPPGQAVSLRPAKSGNFIFGKVGCLFNGLCRTGVKNYAFLGVRYHSAANQLFRAETDGSAKQKNIPASGQVDVYKRQVYVLISVYHSLLKSQ